MALHHSGPSRSKASIGWEYIGSNQPKTARGVAPVRLGSCCGGYRSEATDAADWGEIRSACLLSGWVETAGVGCPETAVRAESARIERRLRSLDALGVGWEGA